MKYIKLEQIADIYLGLTHTPKYVEKGIPFLSVKDISNGEIDFSKCHYITEDEYEKLPKGAKPQVGDMLFCRVGTIGKPIIIDKNTQKFGSFVSLGFLRLKNTEYILEYIKYWMNSDFFMTQVRKNVKGVAQINLNTGWLSKFEVPIYKLEHQKEIVNRLSSISNLIKLKKEQLEQLDLLIKSQFVEMFGDIENTKYDVYKLSELTNLITDGEHKKPNYTENGTPFISVVNITTGKLKFEDCKFVSKEDACKFNKRCNPEKDDILYTKVGATYGRSAIVDTDKKFALYVSVCLIKPKKDLINPIFLNYTMRQPYVKTQADKCIKGIGVPDLHLIEIKNFKIILPPIEEQNQFAEFVKQIDKQKFEIENSLKEVQELYESLMEKYFG